MVPQQTLPKAASLTNLCYCEQAVKRAEFFTKKAQNLLLMSYSSLCVKIIHSNAHYAGQFAVQQCTRFHQPLYVAAEIDIMIATGQQVAEALESACAVKLAYPFQPQERHLKSRNDSLVSMN